MECKHQAITAVTAVRQTALAGLLFFIVMTLLIDSAIADSTPEIISTQNEVITYVNHTAKLSCIIQNKHRHHVTWSRVTFINETQKLTSLLFVNLLKYTTVGRYHLTYKSDGENREYWNLEIRNVHQNDQGYYSCVLTATKPISKIFHVKVLAFLMRFTFITHRSMESFRSKDDYSSNCPSFDLTSIKISLEQPGQNPAAALRSTFDANGNSMQRRSKDPFLSSLSLSSSSIFTIFLMNLFLFLI